MKLMACRDCGDVSVDYRSVSGRCRPCRQLAKFAACATCGGAFERKTKTQAYCSPACRNAARRQPKRTATCQHCSTTFAVRGKAAGKFCSRLCAFTFKTLDSLTRPKPPRRPAKPKVPTSCRVYFQDCSECGTTFTSRHSRKVCDEKCRRRRAARLRQAPEPKPVDYRWWECRVCEAPFALPSWITDARYCSKRCRRQRFDSHRTRALHAGVHYEYVRPHDIYERDGWTCGLCGDRVDELAKWPDQMCASLDHVVPISMGGPHEAGNLRLAHWLCNSLRGTDDIHFRVS